SERCPPRWRRVTAETTSTVVIRVRNRRLPALELARACTHAMPVSITPITRGSCIAISSRRTCCWMAHWQLGDKEPVRKLYDQAVEGMEKNPPEKCGTSASLPRGGRGVAWHKAKAGHPTRAAWAAEAS